MKRLYPVFILILLIVCALTLVSYAYMPKHRTFIFTYDIIIKDIPAHTSEVKVWAPYPTQDPYQEVKNIDLDVKWLYSITYDKKYHNKIIYYHIKSPKSPSIRISQLYRVVRYEHSNLSPKIIGKGNRLVDPELRKHLMPNKLLTTGPKIKQLAAAITEGKDSTIDKARAIYDYIFRNFSYDKTVPGWGKGDTERACIILAGNCTDFHSFFISLCRACGIPAKFNMGILLPKEDKGTIKTYHCWAEFYSPHAGWIPVDISEAWKDKSKYGYFFGTIDENRIELSNGRDIILEPTQGGEPLNYFIWPYVEIDGKAFDKIDAAFVFEDITAERGWSISRLFNKN